MRFVPIFAGRQSTFRSLCGPVSAALFASVRGSGIAGSSLGPSLRGCHAIVDLAQGTVPSFS